MRGTLLCLAAAALLLPGSAVAGDGTFPEDRAFAVPTTGAVQDLAVGDFDADGNVDLAIATAGTDVEIAVGDGEGGFDAANPVEVGTIPRVLAVGDFDADGDEDLAIAVGDRIDVYTGGDGAAFAPAGAIDLDGGVRELLVGDFNTDGDPDLAISWSVTLCVINGGCSTNWKVQVATGAAGAAFAAPSDVTGDSGDGVPPGGLGIGDFNHDLDEDLVLSYQAGASTLGGMRIATGTGAGAEFTAAEMGVAGERALVVGEFDDDGHEDVAVVAGATVRVMTGDGTGSFSDTLEPGGPEGEHLAVGDFDSDGDDDLASGAGGGARISHGGPGASFATGAFVTAGTDGSSVVVADFDGDGNEDLAMGGPSSVTVRPGGGPAPLAGNLLANGGFEGAGAAALFSQTPEIPGWERTGGMTFMRYGNHFEWAAPTHLESPRFQTGGLNYLSGGDSDGTQDFRTTAFQTVDVPLTPATIDAGLATAALSAWLGGALAYPDAMSATASFRDAGGAELGSFTVGPVTLEDRQQLSTLLLRSGSAPLPAGTRAIRVTLASQDTDRYSSAMADNVELTVSSTDADGDGVGDGADACPGQAAPTPNGCPAGAADTTPPELRLAGKRRQKLRRRIAITVLAAAEPRTIGATARLRIGKKRKRLKAIAAREVASGAKARLRARLSKRVVRRVRAALRKGKRVRVRFVVTAADVAGNRVSARRTVRLRR